MGDDRKKVCTEQLSLLLTEIENDPSLINGRTGSAKMRTEYTEKWTRLAEKLNAVENGVFKDIHKWQQAWRDWKSNTKKKAFKIWKDKSERDGSSQELNSLEVRLLNLFDSETEFGGIDITSITEVDPLTSDDEDRSYSPSEMKPLVLSPEMMTVYSEGVDECKNGHSLKYDCSYKERRSHSEESDTVNCKRKRISINANSTEIKFQETTDILQRLSELERSQLETDKRQNVLLETAVKALERQAAAAVRQAEATERQAKCLERLSRVLEKRFSGHIDK